ncbi:MAG: glutathione peroxidase [Burkholderiaceae bacterium]
MNRLAAPKARRWIAVGLAFLAVAAPALAETAVSPAPSAAACPALLNHSYPRLQDEAPQNLCQFAGQVVLVVNTASYCGYTHQYEGLEALFARYGKRGLVVLGFPSNDFGQQEPGSANQIADLCFNTYGVRFPMFSKVAVTGPLRTPMYEQLFKATQVAPGWNFHKYLIARDGRTVQSFPSAMEPNSREITSAIEAALNRHGQRK